MQGFDRTRAFAWGLVVAGIVVLTITIPEFARQCAIFGWVVPPIETFVPIFLGSMLFTGGLFALRLRSLLRKRNSN
jgi:hypothetical protein